MEYTRRWHPVRTARRPVHGIFNRGKERETKPILIVSCLFFLVMALSPAYYAQDCSVFALANTAEKLGT